MFIAHIIYTYRYYSVPKPIYVFTSVVLSFYYNVLTFRVSSISIPELPLVLLILVFTGFLRILPLSSETVSFLAIDFFSNYGKLITITVLFNVLN